ncbi:hypothetical protein D3C76_1803710 [compost metagenome]
MLFFAPFIIVSGKLGWLWPVCILSVLAAIEELVLHLSSPSLNINKRGLFFKDP